MNEALDLDVDMEFEHDRPVCLTSSAPFDIQPNQLVLYDVIDVATTSRSGVLSTIAYAGGEARLPGAITLSDFKRWIRFVEDNSKRSEEDSLEDLCTVVKVTPASACPPLQ